MNEGQGVVSTVETERRQRLEDALGSLRLEGLAIAAEAQALADRYVASELPADEMTRAMRALRI